MIFKYKKIFSGFVLLFALLQLQANDTLTVRQAFNWQVGDTFVYTYYVAVGPDPTDWAYSNQEGFSVKSRVDLSDSIFYSVQYFDNSLEQRIITHLDSSISGYSAMYKFLRRDPCDSLFVNTNNLPACSPPDVTCNYRTYYDSTFNNYLTAYQGYNLYDFGVFIGSYSYLISENVGLRDLAYFSYKPDPHGLQIPISCGAKLSYYRSGSVFYMDPISYWLAIMETKSVTAEFHTYPNPTSNILFIERASNSSEGEEIKIYDLQSRLISTRNFPINLNKEEVDISSLSAGVYIISLDDKTGQTIFRSKVLKQ